MLNPQIKSQVKLFTNEGINENVFRQNGSEGQKISGSLFNVTENKLFGENKVKLNDSIFQSKEAREQSEPDNSVQDDYEPSEDFKKQCAPGRHVLSDGTIVINDKNRRRMKTEYNPNDKNKRFTVESKYYDDYKLISANYEDTYRDNNNNVRYTEEHTSDYYKDEGGNLVIDMRTTVRDAKGNVVFVMIEKQNTKFETVDGGYYNSYNAKRKSEVIYQDANGKEISVKQAFAKLNKLRTPAMREGLKWQDEQRNLI